MITPGLEALILEGKAEYISYATGGSGVATIPFPKRASLMYVVDFLWMPFNDVQNTIDETDPVRLNQRIIHTMSLNNGRKKSYFNFRDAIFKFVDSTTQKQVPLFPPPIQINTFIESNQDIYVNIFNFNNASTMTGFYDSVPVSPSQEPLNPNGYGGERATRRTQMALGQITNMGTDRDPVAAGAPFIPARNRNEFFDDISALTSLNDWDTVGDQKQHYMFPLVTFGVVIINKTQTARGR